MWLIHLVGSSLWSLDFKNLIYPLPLAPINALLECGRLLGTRLKLPLMNLKLILITKNLVTSDTLVGTVGCSEVVSLNSLAIFEGNGFGTRT
jgi:hypothetical protein